MELDGGDPGAQEISAKGDERVSLVDTIDRQVVASEAGFGCVPRRMVSEPLGSVLSTTLFPSEIVDVLLALSTTTTVSA